MVAELIRTIPPFVALFLISLAISITVTLVYKFATDQRMMKAIQNEMKALKRPDKGS